MSLIDAYDVQLEQLTERRNKLDPIEDAQERKTLNAEIKELIEQRNKLLVSDSLAESKARLAQIEQDKADDERRMQEAQLEQQKKLNKWTLIFDAAKTALCTSVPFINSIATQRGCFDSEREIKFLDGLNRSRRR